MMIFFRVCPNYKRNARNVCIVIEKSSTHLPALTALDFDQILGITNDVRHHVGVVLQRDDHGATVSGGDGHGGAV